MIFESSSQQEALTSSKLILVIIQSVCLLQGALQQPQLITHTKDQGTIPASYCK